MSLHGGLSDHSLEDNVPDLSFLRGGLPDHSLEDNGPDLSLMLLHSNDDDDNNNKVDQNERM